MNSKQLQQQPLPSSHSLLDLESDKFWGDDPAILITTSRLVEFFPTADQTLAERVNAITRLIIYISVIISLYQGKSTTLHFGLSIILLIYFMFKTYKTDVVEKLGIDAFPSHEGLNSVTSIPSVENPVDCVLPTKQNPFMNHLIGDNPNRPSACKGSGIQEMAANLLNEQLFNDVDDLFSKNGNQRLFRTMPSTTAVPDREKFAHWLVKGTDNCKQDKVCPPFDDLRLQRQLIPDDLDVLPLGLQM